MGTIFYYEPELVKPVMFVGWPGIGNIGMIAVNGLKDILQAEEFGRVESWDFFYPRRVSIEDGLLKDLEFPGNKFYYRRLGDRDILFFIGDEQPSEGGKMYGRGDRAYQMASLVLEAGLTFGCRRVYTSGACVSPIHHRMKPRVCAVATDNKLIREVKTYPNAILMSELAGRGEEEGIITGLNGLLLGVAKSRGMEGVCLMGEIPDWLAGASFPYPKASRSVLEVFEAILDIKTDLAFLNEMERQVDGIVESFYAKFPEEMRKEYDQRMVTVPDIPGTITLQAQIYIDERFKKGGEEGGEGPS